ncbi:hypothetical protein [Bacillus sp. JJ722]|uniref:deoxynucleotide monophosphate kinase family protein n=1 Tax=Bacillus sp. JJ722 TaxID=3122973 RepID=UPI002FFF4E87
MSELITVNKTIKLTKAAICGRARAGKDEVANQLRFKHGFRALAFATKLKDLAHRAFPHIDPSQKPRKLYQDFGEALCAIDPQVWIRHVDDDIASYIRFIANSSESEANIVVTDLRKPVEYDWLRAQGFTIIRVSAPEELRLKRAKLAREIFEPVDLSHDTESYVDGFEVDYELVNDGTLDEFYAKVDTIMGEIKTEG